MKLKTDWDELERHDAYICSYARFHQPVPPGPKLEPVGEFKSGRATSEFAKKYAVDRMVYTSIGLIFEAHGIRDIVPLANVIHARIS